MFMYKAGYSQILHGHGPFIMDYTCVAFQLLQNPKVISTQVTNI